MAINDEFKLDLLPEGVGGILYHSSMFDSDFINFNFNNIEDEFLKNDDLILRAYTFIKNIQVYCIFSSYNDMEVKQGLHNNYNANYIINFQKYIDKVKNIIDYTE
jgi:hypothetical protein